MSFAESTGQKISSWYNANKSWIVPVAIGAGVVGAVVATVATGGAAAPALAVAALATGGITTGPTTALIGEAGQEAVLPLQNNTGWMDTLASRIVSQIPSSGSRGDINLEMTVKYGDETIARKQIKAINRLQKASGKTLITV